MTCWISNRSHGWMFLAWKCCYHWCYSKGFPSTSHFIPRRSLVEGRKRIVWSKRRDERKQWNKPCLSTVRSRVLGSLLLLEPFLYLKEARMCNICSPIFVHFTVHHFWALRVDEVVILTVTVAMAQLNRHSCYTSHVRCARTRFLPRANTHKHPRIYGEARYQ